MMKRFLVYSLLILSCVSIITPPAVAQSPLQQPLPDYVQTLANAGAEIHYLGNDLGLNGWMAVKGGTRQYVYVTPNQEAYIVGLLLDRTGQLITTGQLDRFLKANPSYLSPQQQSIIPQQSANPTEQVPNYHFKNDLAQTFSPSKNPTPAPAVSSPDSPSQKLFSKVQAGDWVEIGQSTAPLIYAFIDPECPHCHKFITNLRESGAYEKGQIRTRLLPVGIMGEESLYEAVKLIESPTPQKTFFDHIDGDEFALPVDKSLNIQKVQKNMSLMQDWGLDVTPFIVYKNKNGEIKIVRGAPKDLDLLLNDLQ